MCVCTHSAPQDHSLHLEVVRCQFGVVDVQDDLGVDPVGEADLREEDENTTHEVNEEEAHSFIRSTKGGRWVGASLVGVTGSCFGLTLEGGGEVRPSEPSWSFTPR